MLKVSDLARRLNLSQSKIYELIDAGELAHYRIGGAIRVSEEQLAEFLQGTKKERRETGFRKPRLRRGQFRHLQL